MYTRNDFEALFEHRMSDAQMEHFLRSLVLDETMEPQTIAMAAEVMREHALRLQIDPQLRPHIIDVVGTGGDRSGSFNVSSTVAIILAACDVFVAKHGNRSITSRSGSADVLEHLGIRLDLDPMKSTQLLQESGFTFLFAQYHHPAMRFIMPIRRAIADKTLFNILGPLTNPVGLSKILLGVFDPLFVPKMAHAAAVTMDSAIVVSSRDKMDEISISDITYAAHVDQGNIREFEIDPQMLGIQKAPFEAILGGDCVRNGAIMRAIFANEATEAQRDMVLINAAYALLAAKVARDPQEGLERAREALLSGRAQRKLEQIIHISAML